MSSLKMEQLPSAKVILSAAASAATTVVLVRSVAKDFLPREIQDYLYMKVRKLFSTLFSQITITIDEFEGLTENQLFHASELYLGTKVSPSTQRFRASIPAKETKVILSMDKNQEVIDVFEGVQFNWRKVNKKVESKYVNYNDDGYSSTTKSDIGYLELSFHKKHKDMVFTSYIPHIVSESLRYKEEKKTLKIHTLKYDRMFRGTGHRWISVNLSHPSTFATLAMDPDMKKMIMDDMELFVKRKEFYRKVGKAWKRGYLLYGPPGTGKSSLIAAMANYLNFDIYDLDLTSVSDNSELRKLIIGTANRSILVVEDIDCSIELEDRKKGSKGKGKTARHHPQFESEPKITLSGLLNFIDGLWSSCGDERIIIFTTNHKERLDPALLRPGRMDVHLHMSYCTPYGFRMLASNYLGITSEQEWYRVMSEEVEELIVAAKATPAEVGEQLMKTGDPETAMKRLVEFLKVKIEEEERKISEKEAVDGEVVEEDDDEIVGGDDGGIR